MKIEAKWRGGTIVIELGDGLFAPISAEDAESLAQSLLRLVDLQVAHQVDTLRLCGSSLRYGRHGKLFEEADERFKAAREAREAERNA